MRAIYLIYLGWFIGLTIALPILLVAIEAATGFDLSSSAVSIIPAMTAANVAGMSFVKRFGRAPTKSETWRFSFVAFALLVVSTLALTVALVAAVPEERAVFTEMLESDVLVFLSGLLLLVLLASFFTNWFFFRLGSKSQIKADQRKQSKAG